MLAKILLCLSLLLATYIPGPINSPMVSEVVAANIGDSDQCARRYGIGPHKANKPVLSVVSSRILVLEYVGDAGEIYRKALPNVMQTFEAQVSGDCHAAQNDHDRYQISRSQLDQSELYTDTVLQQVELVAFADAFPEFALAQNANVDLPYVGNAVPLDANQVVLDILDASMSGTMERYIVTAINGALVVSPVNKEGVNQVGLAVSTSFREIFRTTNCGIAFDPQVNVIKTQSGDQILVLEATAGGSSRNTTCFATYLIKPGQSLVGLRGNFHRFVNPDSVLADYPKATTFKIEVANGAISDVYSVISSNASSSNLDRDTLVFLDASQFLQRANGSLLKVNVEGTSTYTQIRADERFVYSSSSAQRPHLQNPPDAFETTPLTVLPIIVPSPDVADYAGVLSITLGVMIEYPQVPRKGPEYFCVSECIQAPPGIMPTRFTPDNSQRGGLCSANLDDSQTCMVTTMSNANLQYDENGAVKSAPLNMGARVTTYTVGQGVEFTHTSATYYIPGVLNLTNIRYGVLPNALGKSVGVVFANISGVTQAQSLVAINTATKKAALINPPSIGQITTARVGDFANVSVTTVGKYSALCTTEGVARNGFRLTIQTVCMFPIEAKSPQILLPSMGR